MSLEQEQDSKSQDLDPERELSSDIIIKFKNELNDAHAKNNEMCANLLNSMVKFKNKIS